MFLGMINDVFRNGYIEAKVLCSAFFRRLLRKGGNGFLKMIDIILYASYVRIICIYNSVGFIQDFFVA